MADELTSKLSDEEITKMKAQFASNPTIIKMLEGEETMRAVTRAKAKAEADFKDKVLKLAKLPPPPEGVYNIYLAWADVEEEVGEPVKVVIEGKEEMRRAKVVAKRWVPEVNKSIKLGKETVVGTNGQGVAKRAITVFKRQGTSLVIQGNFRSAKEACSYLKLAVGNDSATRVLTTNGYTVDAYQGTDYTITSR